MVEDGEGPPSLLLTERFLTEAPFHHLTHDNQVQLVMGQLRHLATYGAVVVWRDGSAARTVVRTKVTFAAISSELRSIDTTFSSPSVTPALTISAAVGSSMTGSSS